MKILVVIVRYQMLLSESPAVRGVCDAFSSHPDLSRGGTLMVWDNSPEEILNLKLPIDFVYRHSNKNLGVSGAYNGAMEYAIEHGYPWMLLLDQDTEIGANDLRSMMRHGHDLEGNPEIAAIVPTVSVQEFVVSPRQQLFNRHCPYPARSHGVLPGEAAVANSGCLIRTSTLHEIGGFSNDFWLDFSDLYVFHQLFLRGHRVWWAADIVLEHEMSMMDYGSLMTPWRFRNFSYAETAFYDLYKGWLENAVQAVRLIARSAKLRIKCENPEFSRIAWNQFVRRLTVPREARITWWLDEAKRRTT